jgi:hypothetical protein
MDQHLVGNTPEKEKNNPSKPLGTLSRDAALLALSLKGLLLWNAGEMVSAHHLSLVLSCLILQNSTNYLTQFGTSGLQASENITMFFAKRAPGTDGNAPDATTLSPKGITWVMDSGERKTSSTQTSTMAELQQ